jgi:hypothetical protein
LFRFPQTLATRKINAYTLAQRRAAMEETKQIKLAQSQIEAFYVDCFNESQLNDFIKLTSSIKLTNDHNCVVDVGGGVGYFARNLNNKTGASVRVIDSDFPSIKKVNKLENKNIFGIVGDALNPEIKGDENIVCFNLILHHLVGSNENKTRILQKQALLAWKNTNASIFVNEYIYESFVGYLSGRLIYEITSNRILSAIAAAIGRVIPSLKANTLGIGVRFRANDEWVKLFEECGYTVASMSYGEVEYTAIPLRLLFIKQVRRDSFLLVKSNQLPLST